MTTTVLIVWFYLCVMGVQENPLMHKGHPCEALYPDEYFRDGITNGAQWYSVPGTSTPFILSRLPIQKLFNMRGFLAHLYAS